MGRPASDREREWATSKERGWLCTSGAAARSRAASGFVMSTPLLKPRQDTNAVAHLQRAAALAWQQHTVRLEQLLATVHLEGGGLQQMGATTSRRVRTRQTGAQLMATQTGSCSHASSVYWFGAFCQPTGRGRARPSSTCCCLGEGLTLQYPQLVGYTYKARTAGQVGRGLWRV